MSPSASVETLSYDPLGRLRQTATASSTVQFVHDGSELVGEYAGSTLLHRYVHATANDEPLASVCACEVRTPACTLML